MKFDIKHKFTGSVLFSGEFGSLKLCVEAAVKTGADLGGADLRGAYLRGADLRGADLRGADLRGADLDWAYLRGAYLRGAYLGGGVTAEITPIQILGLHWDVYIFDAHMRIGCKHYAIDVWDSFTDQEIAEMGDHALDFWRGHKDMLMTIAWAHHAEAKKVKDETGE